MFTDVHGGVGAERVAQPAVGREVVVARRQSGVVVDRHRILPEAAGRLDEDRDVPGAQRGEHDLPGGIGGVVDEERAGCRAPVLGDVRLEVGREPGEPRLVVRRRDPDRVALELLRSSASPRPGRRRR